MKCTLTLIFLLLWALPSLALENGVTELPSKGSVQSPSPTLSDPNLMEGPPPFQGDDFSTILDVESSVNQALEEAR